MKSTMFEIDVRFGDALFSVLCFQSKPNSSTKTLSDQIYTEPLHSHPYYETHFFHHNSRDDSEIAVSVSSRVINSEW